MIVAYVSGHGFGHATRTAEVLRRVRELQPQTAITVVSAAPERLFRRAIGEPLSFRTLACDVGLVQKDALTIDTRATVERWKGFARALPDLVDAEWRWLRHVRARVVLGDIPPLAFQAAHEAGVPSVAMANFSWDWIYAHYASREPLLRDAARCSADQYGRASVLLRLPFAGDMSAFPRVEDIGLVAREPGVARAEVRRRLDLGAQAVVLLSFGGFGLPGLDLRFVSSLAGFVFLSTDVVRLIPAPPNLRLLTDEVLDAKELTYQDVVGAADVVVTKPGYGIVSDAIAAGVRMIYTDRGDFPEYDVLVRDMKTSLACVHLDQAELRKGRLGDALRDVMALDPPPAPDLSGGDVAAWRLLELGARGA